MNKFLLIIYHIEWCLKTFNLNTIKYTLIFVCIPYFETFENYFPYYCCYRQYKFADVFLVFIGKNGDVKQNKLIHALLQLISLFKNVNDAVFAYLLHAWRQGWFIQQIVINKKLWSVFLQILYLLYILLHSYTCPNNIEHYCFRLFYEIHKNKRNYNYYVNIGIRVLGTHISIYFESY